MAAQFHDSSPYPGTSSLRCCKFTRGPAVATENHRHHLDTAHVERRHEARCILPSGRGGLGRTLHPLPFGFHILSWRDEDAKARSVPHKYSTISHLMDG